MEGASFRRERGISVSGPLRPFRRPRRAPSDRPIRLANARTCRQWREARWKRTVALRDLVGAPGLPPRGGRHVRAVQDWWMGQTEVVVAGSAGIS